VSGRRALALLAALLLATALAPIQAAQACEPGSISGAVTDASTTPVAGAYIGVYDISGNWAGMAVTDASGSYTVGGLPPGYYKAAFAKASYAAEWWNGQPDFASANWVVVTAGADTPGVDATLSLPGSISGTVTEQATGDPVAGTYIGVYDTAGKWAGTAVTDTSGDYTVGNLGPGAYKVAFAKMPYAIEWWNGQPTFGSADAVAVTAATDTPGVDATLDMGGSISGTVTDESTGSPLAGVEVSTFSLMGWGFVGSASTDASGNYTVAGLAAGNYRVRFYAPPDAAEWWDGQPDFGSADPVTVTAATDTPGVDATLDMGGSISGTVTEASAGNPLTDAHINVYDASGYLAGGTMTDASGHYMLGGLAAGDYRVAFWAASYAVEWWNGQPTFASADPVAVTVGVDTPGVDAVLVGGSLSGTVTEQATGNPLTGVYIGVYDTSGNWAGGTTTNSLGTYTLGNLLGGYYKVVFSKASYAIEWWDQQPAFGSADLVTVVAGGNTPGVDASLVPPTLPGAPTGLQAMAENGQVTVSFSPPGSDGGAPITDYVILYRQGSGDWVWFPDTVSTTPSITVTGLIGGLAYDFEAAAINSVGLGPWSTPIPGTPT
jgi:uncharacterized surface anchored protein